MMLIVASCILAALIVLIAIVIQRRRDEFSFFKKLGIPGPEPHFLWGHYDKFQRNHIECLEKWAKEYGDLYGIFLGTKPFLISTDVELAQLVMLKEFSNFMNRAPLFELERSDPNVHGFLSLQEGEAWRRQRSVITPAFTSKNMKDMLPLILEGADDFISCLEKQEGRFDIVPFVKNVSVDNLGRTVFGIDVGAQSGTRNNIQQIIFKVMDSFLDGTLDLLANSFSTFGRRFSRLLFYLSKCGIISRASDDLGKFVANMLASKKHGPKSNNLLQRLIDATEFNETSPGGVPILTRDELVCNSVGSFYVGVDTTSITLSYLFYCLGQHQEVQERLREEIKRDVGEELDYNNVSKLKYLDNVINEVLRLYPPVTGYNSRTATRPFSHKGYTLPAGTNVLFVVSSMHRDERHWSDPLEFRPERFENRTNAALAFQPYGDGPRNCVGMRLAKMSMKFLVVRALQEFRFKSFGNVERYPASVLSKPGEVLVTVERLKHL